MIYDKLKNYQKYTEIHSKFQSAFDYLVNTEFSEVKPGKYLIDGDNIFALVQEYSPKNETECKLEGHQKYIDIQYIYSGKEFMGYKLRYNQEPINKVYENDLAFFDDTSINIEVKSGEFIIFFPEDLHKPCIATPDSDTVKKIVIKIKN